jgi:hypothetical protein
MRMAAVGQSNSQAPQTVHCDAIIFKAIILSPIVLGRGARETAPRVSTRQMGVSKNRFNLHPPASLAADRRAGASGGGLEIPHCP